MLQRVEPSFQLERAGANRRFTLSGEVDLAVAGGLVELLRRSCDGAEDLTLDLSGLSFLDSSGIHAFIEIKRLLRGRLILESPTDPVARVFDLVGLARLPGIEIRRI